MKYVYIAGGVLLAYIIYKKMSKSVNNNPAAPKASPLVSGKSIPVPVPHSSIPNPIAASVKTQ